VKIHLHVIYSDRRARFNKGRHYETPCYVPAEGYNARKWSGIARRGQLQYTCTCG